MPDLWSQACPYICTFTSRLKSFDRTIDRPPILKGTLPGFIEAARHHLIRGPGVAEHWFTAPKHIHPQSSSLGGRYTSASVRINSVSTAGSHFLQPPLRRPAMLLSFHLHLMTQNGVPLYVFSSMGSETDKSHSELSLVSRGGKETRYCEFWRGTLLPIGIKVLCIIMQKIPVVTVPELKPRTMNGFPKTTSSRSVASVICASVW
ncbi:hypothetical protein TNCV_3332571 [Trichonephila clavipes]|nr:hypothetical protein TNCV_3332571 [Trichonephila clavipes]